MFELCGWCGQPCTPSDMEDLLTSGELVGLRLRNVTERGGSPYYHPGCAEDYRNAHLYPRVDAQLRDKEARLWSAMERDSGWDFYEHQGDDDDEEED